MGYPEREAEITMLDTHATVSIIDDLASVASAQDVEGMIEVARGIHVAPSLKGYIIDLAEATRRHPTLALGMSPRSALALQRAARALAASFGRDYVVPDDIKGIARPVLQHRLTLTPEAHLGSVESSDVLDDILRSVPVPTGRG
jgi:MoxR-like ATPase